MDKLTREQKDLHEKEVLELLIPALSKHLTVKEGWKFLDTVNPILYKSGSPWIYMLFGDGLAVTLAMRTLSKKINPTRQGSLPGPSSRTAS